MADEDLPKHQLLIKLMGMTGSSSDGEALVAIRKANELLKAAGWDWERVLNGKIKVIESPFKKAAVDSPFERRQAPSPTQTPRPQPAWKPAPAPPQPKIFRASATEPLGTVQNKFADFCYCCGTEVISGAGFIFDPWTRVPTAVSKWRVSCVPCNTSGLVAYRAAPPVRNKKKPAVTDLA